MRLMLLCCTWKDERMGEEEAGGSLPICTGCKQRIYDEQYLQALSSDWHTVCFRYKLSTLQHATQQLYLLISLFLSPFYCPIQAGQ
ncbi:hypothetical protein CgunFtcFv8_010552 [Champsocephalus gunnari]|uniref:LIM zinc-binding domain-containing protein n=1 Tax=Champsocephalus gunnari TaxID=52237 RepID=A0AAN8DV61_CHAGU|nr:hypothetical protein CgunFtcFv8_010552 [Champsocephalus gunnari]